MANLVIVGVAILFGFILKSTMGIFITTMYTLSVACILFYVHRKVPEYPFLKVYEMFKSNPLHNGRTDAVGMVVVITGSTSGIGQKLADEWYRFGATVVIASRNPKKGESVIEEILAANPGSKGKLVFGRLDTSDLDSVRDFADWAKQNFTTIDYLINNAGIQYGSSEGSPLTNMSTKIESKQGYDLCLATNYIGHFLLTHLLLPMIRCRIVDIASSFHFQADGTTLNPKLGTNGVPDAAIGVDRPFRHRASAYGVSKLANVLHAIELQKRLAGNTFSKF
jgi:NAD(P)-dependent dehydrogenase (short-subunit alcohol dehydrogenase family)